VKIVLAGAGAFGQKHLDALGQIGGIEVVSLVGRELDKTRAVARKYAIEHVTTELGEALARPGVEAAILCTPTQLHARQAIQCLQAGKHVQVEIPLADSWPDAQAVATMQRETGLVCMVGHTRRFNPSHQWLHRRIASGELRVLQMNVQTYFSDAAA
jgi:2-hydroxy-4-carboxymuconate semialdehyde hemiacetal dehydrogenase